MTLPMVAAAQEEPVIPVPALGRGRPQWWT